MCLCTTAPLWFAMAVAAFFAAVSITKALRNNYKTFTLFLLLATSHWRTWCKYTTALTLATALLQGPAWLGRHSKFEICEQKYDLTAGVIWWKKGRSEEEKSRNMGS